MKISEVNNKLNKLQETLKIHLDLWGGGKGSNDTAEFAELFSIA